MEGGAWEAGTFVTPQTAYSSGGKFIAVVDYAAQNDYPTDRLCAGWITRLQCAVGRRDRDRGTTQGCSLECEFLTLGSRLDHSNKSGNQTVWFPKTSGAPQGRRRSSWKPPRLREALAPRLEWTGSRPRSPLIISTRLQQNTNGERSVLFLSCLAPKLLSYLLQQDLCPYLSEINCAHASEYLDSSTLSQNFSSASQCLKPTTLSFHSLIP